MTTTQDIPPIADTPETDERGPQRVTVNLSARSAAALDETSQRAGETKTDTINKALQLYAEMRKMLDEGGALYIREPGSKEIERIRLF